MKASSIFSISERVGLGDTPLLAAQQTVEVTEETFGSNMNRKPFISGRFKLIKVEYFVRKTKKKKNLLILDDLSRLKWNILFLKKKNHVFIFVPVSPLLFPCTVK